MDLPVEEKLLILLDKATNPFNSELDVGRIDAFCCAVKNEPGVAMHATKLLADRIQSANPNESLNALNLLDECMGKCGSSFQNAVGRFRFLNELVKLVSPKYLSNSTNPQVKTKILDLLLLWTVQYPKEGKIKEAYEMLRRQGVVHESPNPISIQKNKPPPIPNAAATPPPPPPPVDPTSMKIKQLIQSKNPDRVDIHAANLLIQNFYEIEKKKTLRVQEIKKGRENVTVLEEMLEHYNAEESSADDKALLQELYESCKLLQPTILLLTEEQNQDEQVMQDALETNDLLMQVVQKYEAVVLKEGGGVGEGENDRRGSEENYAGLGQDDALIDMQGVEGMTRDDPGEDSKPLTDDLNSLLDIFGSLPEEKPNPSIGEKNFSVLTPENLSGGVSIPSQTVKKEVKEHSTRTDIDSMISELMQKATTTTITVNGLNSTPALVIPQIIHNFEGINVDLNAIETSTDVPPLTVLNEPAGLKVVLNFTKEHPREDIAVIVATIANQSQHSASQIELTLHADNSDCQVKHLNGTGNRSLSGVKRFSSAFDDLAEIILVSNPKRVHVDVWTVSVKYLMNGEEHKEDLTVSDLPTLF